MRRIFSFILALVMVSALGLAAMAAEDGREDDGFYIEEAPAFGEEDVLIFPDDEVLTAEPTAGPTPAAGTVTENTDPDNAAAEGDSERADQGEAPAPDAQDTAQVSAGHNYLPVIIILAVLAVCVIVFVIVKKRGPAGRGNG